MEEGEIYSVDPTTIAVHKFQVVRASFPSDPEYQADAPSGVACSIVGHRLAGDDPDTMFSAYIIFDDASAMAFTLALSEILFREGGEMCAKPSESPPD